MGPILFTTDLHRGDALNDLPLEIAHAALTALLHQQRRAGALLICLSARERDVVIALGRGERPRCIAARLHISVKTVATFRVRALAKLHLSSTSQIAVLCFQAGLIPGVVP